jgi:hypothetical protein
MRKIIFFGIGIVLLLVVSWGIYKVTKPHQSTAGQQAVATLSASTLYQDFVQNETTANKKWVGKILEITGTISAVQETGSSISVSLRVTTDGGVNCSILKKDLDPRKKLNQGDSIIVKGRCTGYLMDVNMVDCVIVK